MYYTSLAPHRHTTYIAFTPATLIAPRATSTATTLAANIYPVYTDDLKLVTNQFMK